MSNPLRTHQYRVQLDARRKAIYRLTAEKERETTAKVAAEEAKVAAETERDQLRVENRQLKTEAGSERIGRLSAEAQLDVVRSYALEQEAKARDLEKKLLEMQERYTDKCTELMEAEKKARLVADMEHVVRISQIEADGAKKRSEMWNKVADAAFDRHAKLRELKLQFSLIAHELENMTSPETPVTVSGPLVEEAIKLKRAADELDDLLEAERYEWAQEVGIVFGESYGNKA